MNLSDLQKLLMTCCWHQFYSSNVLKVAAFVRLKVVTCLLCTHPALRWSIDRTDGSSSPLHEVDKVSLTVLGLERWTAEIISDPNQELDVLWKLADYKTRQEQKHSESLHINKLSQTRFFFSKLTSVFLPIVLWIILNISNYLFIYVCY